MLYTKSINNKSVLGIIRRFCNYIDPRLTEHGSHVAYLVFRMLGKTGEYSKPELRNICFAAQLHDIGAYKTEEISRMLQFETNDVWDHSFYGYLFIRYFSPLHEFAPAVLLHHTAWKYLEQEEALSPKLKNLCQAIHIADRIDVSMSVEKHSLVETLQSLNNGTGTIFAPHMLDLANKLNFKESIEEEWRKDEEYFDFLSKLPLSSNEITEYFKMLVFIIDFRSHYTVTHTIATTSISYELGLLLSLSEESLNQVLCGSLLHDLGKIAIPVEILEYPGKLSTQAMTIMRTHVNLTEKIFGGNIDETIQRIALRHHEKLNGTGYPNQLTADDLTTEERLVAIADIISALTGTRSYKGSFPKERIVSILSKMRDDGLVDPFIVNLALQNLDHILEITTIRSKPLLEIYEKLRSEYLYISKCNRYREKIRYALSLERPKNMCLWP
ncbi:HD domain-containing phosphohydrolase [Clostridium sp. E02]|uniref:HD-GYP domain-containing protein n=1 Tax=Clostridium sp. E02 TaxID=2487134 RepID=UPI000F525F79|nr:HD domain-containing phosphohydrolase [Clostridium sp. E02]